MKWDRRIGYQCPMVGLKATRLVWVRPHRIHPGHRQGGQNNALVGFNPFAPRLSNGTNYSGVANVQPTLVQIYRCSTSCGQ